MFMDLYVLYQATAELLLLNIYNVIVTDTINQIIHSVMNVKGGSAFCSWQVLKIPMFAGGI